MRRQTRRIDLHKSNSDVARTSNSNNTYAQDMQRKRGRVGYLQQEHKYITQWPASPLLFVFHKTMASEVLLVFIFVEEKQEKPLCYGEAEHKKVSHALKGKSQDYCVFITYNHLQSWHATYNHSALLLA
ncbi:hypothetical protein AMECASPLE_008697 [Ameca splendens]|uniref:Uncharacterized protein n=1 Tax=Ameca splendens TaxID=208324 RepID=A0ABV0ZK82_9TELE